MNKSRALLLALLICVIPLARGQQAGAGNAQAVTRVATTVSDLERSIEFYRFREQARVA